MFTHRNGCCSFIISTFRVKNIEAALGEKNINMIVRAASLSLSRRVAPPPRLDSSRPSAGISFA